MTTKFLMDEELIARNMNGIALYKAYDGLGRLLYVGIAKSWPKRWAEHAAFSPWVYEVTRLEVQYFATRKEALARERQAITEGNPRWNSAHKPVEGEAVSE